MRAGPIRRTVEGALAGAASAVGARDHEALFAVLDQRSRFALSSVYTARKAGRGRFAAATRKRRSAPLWPSSAMPWTPGVMPTSSGSAAGTPASMHSPPCWARPLRSSSRTSWPPSRPCAAPRPSSIAAMTDGYGLVWETATLVRERTRAAAELDLIRKNGQQYASSARCARARSAH